MTEPILNNNSTMAPQRPRVTSDGRSRLISGFGVWTFSAGVWDLVADHCAEGYAPGAPPTEQGAYEGQSIRKEGVKKPEPELEPAL